MAGRALPGDHLATARADERAGARKWQLRIDAPRISANVVPKDSNVLDLDLDDIATL